ncbi:MAG: hypothetical protein IT374_15770 [Polyangiaceae bacterium]|nr:hypothetical protein [Polyangiaceae bacterium]
MRRILTVALPTAALLGFSSQASAQENQLTGPLAGAPAVRGLRLHRKQRFEIAPAVSFTLLDEYQRHILLGARLTYNVTDWLGLGAWGAFGAVKQTTGLSDRIQDANDQRFNPRSPNFTTGQESTGRTLVRANIGKDFKQQLATINWIFSPQITAVPFRGKLSLFQKIFVDTDAYFFAGPAFVNLRERADCGGSSGVDCAAREGSGPDPGNVRPAATKATASRMAIAPTFGLGLSFYTGQWTSFGLEWRALMYSANTGGFDIAGGGEGGRFPDGKVDKSDREFKFNQMITVSFGMQFPRTIKQSD